MTDPIKKTYPDNSHEAKERRFEPAERQPLKKVITGGVTTKKPLGRRIRETFTGDDARTVGDYVLFEVFIPAAKAMISDAVSEGIHRMLFGTSGSGARRASGSSYSYGANRTSYGSKYRSQVPFEDSPREKQMSNRSRASHDFSDLIFDNRGDAEEVLDSLRTLVDSQYAVATVADLYELCELESNYMDRAHGWKDLRDATVKRVREAGYLLDLPAPIRLES